ncbi:hypothetical protein IFT73_05860 [Aeromicrobium sp. CFBP 8757]|uniref:hypothetical protein n=1 Tax=Aeromicrobium sp. CFBP 8757 TaxID=2775288 RepID=UPI001781C6F3|nr:hypothetical protein [Aeromicrobium sp. CFBP 8757]MBD8606374.1 hypothetical protein [Aeromicrobium sp. CFBP 8757]
MRDRPVVIGMRRPHPTAMHIAMREAVAGRTFVQVVHCCAASDADRGRLVLESMRPHASLPERRTPPVGFRLTTAGVVDALERASRASRLLVVGCADATWFTQLRGSDVVARLARHADSPVMVVPHDEREPGRPGRVVLGGGRAAVGAATVRFALEQARDRATVVVVGREAADGATAPVLAELAGEFPDVTIDVHDRPGPRVVAGDLVVVERPEDRSVPFAWSLDPLVATTVTTAVERRCAIGIVPGDGR